MKVQSYDVRDDLLELFSMVGRQKKLSVAEALKPILRSKGFCWVESEPFRAAAFGALELERRGDVSPSTVWVWVWGSSKVRTYPSGERVVTCRQILVRSSKGLLASACV